VQPGKWPHSFLVAQHVLARCFPFRPPILLFAAIPPFLPSPPPPFTLAMWTALQFFNRMKKSANSSADDRAPRHPFVSCRCFTPKGGLIHLSLPTRRNRMVYSFPGCERVCRVLRCSWFKNQAEEASSVTHLHRSSEVLNRRSPTGNFVRISTMPLSLSTFLFVAFLVSPIPVVIVHEVRLLFLR